ncbi:MAG: hypothetical protein HC895_11580 [Leptolyngbyaceae cyanobacterium SM1_3_5]|nr:hypothetical protein [Leptolyngbyaceae cyanobacterium SM1_3_5]
MTTNPPGNGDRLDRIERLLERSIAAADERFERMEAITADNSQSIAASISRLDRTERLVTANSEAIEAIRELTAQNSRDIAALQVLAAETNRTVTTTVLSVDRLSSAILALAQGFDQDQEANRQALASINAALERIDRILDYLIGRDGDRPAQ